MKCLVFAALLTLTACAPPMLDTSGRSSFTPSAPMKILPFHEGGLLFDYENRREKLARYPGWVNMCEGGVSGATIFISLPNACTCPDTLWGFHGAINFYTQQPLPKANEYVLRYYLPNTRHFFLTTVLNAPPGRNVYITGLDLHRMDGVRLCNDGE